MTNRHFPQLFLRFFWILCGFFISLLAQAQSDPLLKNPEKSDRAIQLHEWERYVRGFRREHHFALSAGRTSGAWIIKRFGSIINERRFDNSGYYSRFQYSFHLPIAAGFGYLLGSSFGYQFESVGVRKPFEPVDGIGFPGVILGLVYNLNPVFRFGTLIDASLERHNGLKEQPWGCVDGKNCKPTQISITMQSYQWGVFTDFFYDLSWAIRIEAAKRELRYMRPFEAQNFPVNANIRKSDDWLGLGIVLHLL